MDKDDRRLNLYKISYQSESFATTLVTSQVTYYPNHIRVYTPKFAIKKLNSGYEKIKKKSKHLDDERNVQLVAPETDAERSLRRTKKKIRDYVLCNNFELFTTFTFKDDRYNLDRCTQRMSTWLKNQQKRTSKFQYLIVSEYHKDKAIHFHALMKDYKGQLVPAVNDKTGRIIPGIFNFKSYTHGYSTAKTIRDSELDRIKTGNYLIKYITKDMPLFKGKNRYWASSGLKLPRVEDNPTEWYKDLTPFRTINTDYGIIDYYLLPEAMKRDER